jgi:hypothetical protein
VEKPVPAVNRDKPVTIAELDTMDSDCAASLKLTIVGGQPSKSRRAANLDTIPGGIGRVLRRAAGDAPFCHDLIENRARSLANCGVELTPSERAALSAVSASSLQAMIASMAPSAGK